MKLFTLVFCLLAFLLLSTQISAQNNEMYFSHGADRNVRFGDTISLPLIANGVQDINSMQFTIHFNPHIMEFLSISELDTAAGFSMNDIGTNEAFEGRLYFVFIDPLGSGVSLNDGDTLMNVNLRMVGRPGSESMFGLQSFPVQLQAFGGGSFKDFLPSRVDVQCDNPDVLGRYFTICNESNSSKRSRYTLDLFGGEFPATFILRDTSLQDSLATITVQKDSTIQIPNINEGLFIAEIFNKDSLLVFIDTLIFEEKDSLTATFSTDDASCPQIADGDIFLQEIQNGRGPYTVVWPDGSLHYRSLTNITPGTYEVKIIDAERCETTFELEVDGPEAIVDEDIRAASCPGVSNGRITVEVLNLPRFPDNTLLFSLDSQNYYQAETFNSFSLPPGPFTYFIQDANGCIFKKETFILIENEVFLENSIRQNPSCFNSSDGSVSVIAALRNSQAGNFSFTWSGSSGMTTSHDSAFTATDLDGGLYQLTITHSGLHASCEFTREYHLVEPEPIIIQADSIKNENCFGAENGYISTEISGGNGPYSLNWSTTDTSATLPHLSAGEYILTVTDMNQCMEIDTFSIDTGLLIDISSLNIQNAVCHGSKTGEVNAVINIDHTEGSGPLSYSFMPVTEGTIPLTNDSLIFDNLPAGEYLLSISDTFGCRLDTGIIITEPDSITLMITDSVLSGCGQSNGSLSVEAMGGNGMNYTYTWGNGQDSNSISGISSGYYRITVEDEEGCLQTDSVELQAAIPPQLVFTTIVDVECHGESDGFIALDVEPGSFSIENISWNSGDTTLIRENLEAGIYSVTITDSKNCKLIEDFVVQQPEPIEISFEVIPDSTGTGKGAAIAIVEGGVPPYNFVWNTSPIQTDSIADGVTAGTYQVLVRDDNDCTASEMVEVPMFTSSSYLHVKNLRIFPNPSAGVVHLSIKDHIQEIPYKVITRNTDGKVLSRQEWPVHSNNFDLHFQSSGIYFIEVLYKNGSREQLPVIIQQ